MAKLEPRAEPGNARIPRLGRLIGSVFEPIARASGMTNKEIAERSGLSEGYVSQILRGCVGDPSLSKILSLADAFRDDRTLASSLRDARGEGEAAAVEEAADLLDALAHELRLRAAATLQAKKLRRR